MDTESDRLSISYLMTNHFFDRYPRDLHAGSFTSYYDNETAAKRIKK